LEENMAREYVCYETMVTVASSGTVSGGFQIPDWAYFMGVLVPDIDAGDVGIEVSRDGTNYYPLLDPLDGSDAVILASGADPGWVDFSDILRFIGSKGDHANYWLRFTCASQSSGAVDLYVAFRG